MKKILSSQMWADGSLLGHKKILKYLKIKDEFYIFNVFSKIIYKAVPKFRLYESYKTFVEFEHEDEIYSYISKAEFDAFMNSEKEPKGYVCNNELYLVSQKGEVAHFGAGFMWYEGDGAQFDQSNAQEIPYQSAIEQSEQIQREVLASLPNSEDESKA